MFLLIITSCYEDKGNYDYREMNDIEISVETESSSYALGDKVISKPKLVFTLGKEPSESEELSLRNRFGGDQECLYNFRMYASRVNRGRTLCYSPPSDHYHPRFEVLRRGDIANVCDTFEYDMLDFLKMYELRSIGTALGMPSVGRSMKEAKELLMKVSKEKLAEAWQTTGMDIQDFYRLDILKK